MKNINAARKDSMGFGLIALSFCFFFNPNINIVDILPDFIGYILLCAALLRIGYLNESIDGAISLFKKMIFVDAAKLLAILWVFGLEVTTERNSSLLLFAFIFSVLELIVLIPAYSKLFAGMTEIGYFYSNTAIFGSENKKSRTDKIRNLTFAFVVTKAVLSVLPEFADLSNSSYDETSAFVNIYDHIGTMRVLAFIPVLILGIIWIVSLQSYFSRIRRDRELIDGLRAKYESEILPKHGLFIRKNFGLVCGLFILALCLTLDFRMEYHNMLPDFLAAIIFFVVIAVIQKRTEINRVPLTATSALYFVLSLVSAVAEYGFFDEYYYDAIYRSEVAMRAYALVVIFNILKSAAFLALLWTLLRALFAIVLNHTGFVAGKTVASENEEKMIHGLQKELRGGLILAFVFAVVYVLSDIAYDILAPMYGFMGLINLLFGIVCIALFVRALWAIRHAVETKYMLD